MKYTKLLSVFLLLVFAAGTIVWYYAGRSSESTNNAFTQNDITNISAQISAPVVQSFIKDNQPVKAGELLVVLDDRAYQLALRQAQAGLAQKTAALAKSRARYALQQSIIAAKNIALQSAHSNSALTAAGLKTEQARLPVLASAVTEAEAALELAKADLSKAQLELSYTRITSLSSGIISNRNLQPGMQVQAGQTLASISSTKPPWIRANFKETQLAAIKAGQKVTITIDAYPGRIFNGYVETIAPATGTVFALLPADNSTGNFTKIVQRIPVNIRFDQPLLLASGLSAVVTIDISTTATAAAPAHQAKAGNS